MRYELRKLVFRRECIILLAVFVGYAVFFAVRIKPTNSMLEESVSQYEQHMQEMPETVTKLKQRTDSAPTEYIRKDFEKALACYNVRYEYTPYDSWAVQLGFGIISMREADIVLLLLLLAILSPIFAREKECGMYQLIYTAKGGKSKAFRSKLGAALLLTLIVTLVFCLAIAALTFFRRDIPLSCLSQPVQAFPDLHFCPFALSVGGLLFLHFLIRLCVCLLAVSVMFVFSAFVRGSFAVLGCSAGVMGTLIAMTEISPSAAHLLSKLGLTALFDFTSYLKGYDTVNVFGVPVFKLTLAVLFTVLLIITLFSLSCCIFTRQRRFKNAA